ncbi:MAG: hypothetical protein A2418_02560 [Candidatus Brennerbacteria bacterium RIFOXYC1_FULL_41_11]|uniref:Putative pre-16S rRNA nuclease n=1 Tax=Candidatus Brennerbacteria bacterium RIFOXYD1_FULL_41_16 TaxID=1797529 RepID=A0A1G1XJN5_9BACT|nr:MAG: hypothetical protein A2391_02315 [Candidatus Brennerbacteria bacterium RIFOXYB1_FULL_41_13]OGY39065.1 MAG: hypothetical protein A2418_02560 [Candidatus Brennerbacteria bacterium RIFOXYC1_FULL_41_11]OGY40218.1 MAG: hypothetical protein A2570_02940 [Candidatus Brennerbacteria bacterium RIFOXYD1_FULL_41_16]
MNLLAVDFGEKNIGLAFCDTEIKLPLSLESLRVETEEQALQEISETIKSRNIELAVFGLPLNFEFKETKQSQKTRDFAAKLEEKLGVKIYFINEVLSSLLASRLKESSKNTHSSSALLLLEDYLDKLEEQAK